jgi:hypothetical protein
MLPEDQVPRSALPVARTNPYLSSDDGGSTARKELLNPSNKLPSCYRNPLHGGVGDKFDDLRTEKDGVLPYSDFPLGIAEHISLWDGGNSLSSFDASRKAKTRY